MRTLTTILILFLIVTESFGQMKYEKGYFINNDSKRIECLIKNRDWKNNPTEFSYKLNNSGEAEKGDVTLVREFGIYNDFKFVGADVKIDRSINPKTSITTEKDPIWKQEKLFLKVLVDGKAKLYSYVDQNLERFFYSVGDGAISQLVYKEYKNGLTLVKNTSFREQIWKDLKFTDSSMDLVKHMNYTSTELEQYFKSYNSSFGGPVTEINTQEKKSYLNLKLTPGINFSSASMSIPEGDNGNVHYTKMKYPSNQTFRVGLEAEWVFSYNKFKWAVVFEPTFQSFNSGTESKDGIIKYSSVEFPIGVRYYYHLNENNRLYLNAFYIPGVAANFNSQIIYNLVGNVTPSGIKANGNVAFGGGIDHKKLSLEVRYYTDRTLLKDNFLNPVYSRFSIILGYKIFATKH